MIMSCIRLNRRQLKENAHDYVMHWFKVENATLYMLSLHVLMLAIILLLCKKKMFQKKIKKDGGSTYLMFSFLLHKR